MVATSTAHKLMAKYRCKMVRWNPDSASKVLVDLDPATAGECFTIARSKRFLFGMLLVTGGATPEQIQAFEIIAATDKDGTGAVVVVASDLGGATPNTYGDTLWLECDVEQIREVLAAATHVGVRADMTNATDEAAFVVIEERLEQEGDLTADYVA